jgi:hypothetical protein
MAGSYLLFALRTNCFKMINMSERNIEKNPIFAGDDVLQEVWRVKDEIAAEYNGDIHRFFEDLRRSERTRREGKAAAKSS